MNLDRYYEIRQIVIKGQRDKFDEISKDELIVVCKMLFDSEQKHLENLVEWIR